MRFDRTVVRALVVLAVAQVVGWGSVGLIAIVGRQIANDLQMDLAAVFSGNSVLYVVMGLWAPVLAMGFARFGARPVMIVGAMAAIPGFAVLAAAQGPVSYFGAWVILGTAGSAMLTTAAYIMLNEVAGRNAKSAIGVLMLATGLSSSVFWPATSFLSDAVGWRGTCLVYAALMGLVCLPLYVFGLPRRDAVAAPVGPSASEAPLAEVAKGTFYLIATGVALNAFITFGLSVVLVELFKAEGLASAEAVGFASMLGVIQVSARGLDFLGGGRWDGLTTGLFAGVALPVGMLVLIIGAGAAWSIAGFLLLYGLGSGALAVARATIPLVFYDKAAYARAASHIALPQNLMAAVSPPVLVGVLTHFGSNAVLGLAMLCSCGGLGILLVLRRRRPRGRQLLVARGGAEA